MIMRMLNEPGSSSRDRQMFGTTLRLLQPFVFEQIIRQLPGGVLASLLIEVNTVEEIHVMEAHRK